MIRKDFGSGLVAYKTFRAGDVVSELHWTEQQSSASRWTIQCGDEEHAEPLPAELKYINHSCQPNVFFDVEAGVLLALRDIEPGEEFSFFYPSTEWEMAEPFECHCATSVCLGFINGASTLPPEVLAQYELSGIIRRKLAAAENQLARAAAI
ncbi:MAG: SET domain-containing protein-lysine N-methyltransferase [Acidobacteria bacterium]|nr:SET domain-containing protein-lysine N-methyltransferase [Acidobacteriota bacterium]